MSGPSVEYTDPIAGLEDSSDLLEDDDLTTPLLGSRVAPSNGHVPYRPGSAIGVPSTILEPPNAYRSRWRSIRVMYLTMFLGSVTFTITMSSLWPFLEVLESDVDESFLGWVVAAYSLGQLVASPFFGGWANWRKSSREPLTVSLILTTLSSVFYMYLQTIPSHKKYMMILARGLIGFSAGIVAVVRSYVSGATTMKERTSCMANVSICQALGFILGPVIQAALVPISYPGVSEIPEFHFNMYTAPAFFAATVAVINLLLLIFVFKEHRVFDDDVSDNAQGTKSDHYAPTLNSNSGSYEELEYKLDYVAVVSSIFLFFVVLFMFTVFETIGTPLSMHMYAWTKSRATLYQGLILGGCGLLSIFVFVIVKLLAKKYNERYLLLGGFLFCLGGYIVYIPWGSDLPPLGMAPVQNTPKTAIGPHAMFSFYHNVFYGQDPIDPRQINIDDISDKRLRTEAFITSKLHSSIDNHLAFSQNPKFGAQNSQNVPLVRTFTVSNDTQNPSSIVANKKLIFQSHLKGGGTSDSPEYLQRRPIFSDHGTSQDTTTEITSKNPMLKSRQITISASTNVPPNPSISTINPSLISSRMTSTSMIKTSKSTTSSSTFTTTTTNNTPSTASSTPWGSMNTTASSNQTHEAEGCPWNYAWCRYVPKIHLWQYLIGTILISIGYPVCNLLSYTIYSKVLGPKPQGLWMGWLTASGSFARTVGSIFVSQVYDSFGPQVTFGSSGGLIVCTIIFYLVVFRRLVPFSFKDKSLRRFGGSASVRD